jgi:tRNA pseudouridine55 synthase
MAQQRGEPLEGERAQHERVAGVLNLDKPRGWTSHDVVARVRRLTGVRQVGHAGTLDPMATGVLVVCVGQATRLAEYLSAQPKVYLAEITLGTATDTYDATGRPTGQHPVPALGRDDLDRALDAFRGPIMQAPPPFSALKLDGEALYKRARRGEIVSPPARPVTVHALAILSFDGTVVQARISCSAGTYIRSIAHDLGQALGCGAHLSALRRTAVGRFTADEALALDALAQAAEEGRWQELLWPPAAAVAHLPAITVSPLEATRLAHGQEIPGEAPSLSGPACALDSTGRLLAIVRYDPELRAWRPVKVFNAPG